MKEVFLIPTLWKQIAIGNEILKIKASKLLPFQSLMKLKTIRNFPTCTPNGKLIINHKLRSNSWKSLNDVIHISVYLSGYNSTSTSH